MNYNVLMFALFSFLISSMSYAQEKFTISGHAKESSTGEVLIGASVLVQENNTGAATNAYGFYSITLPKGKYTLRFSYLGYQTFMTLVDLNQNETLNVELVPEAIALEEITITDKRIDGNVRDNQMSKNQIDVSFVKKLPALLGEADMIKTVQTQPGVLTAGEGTSTFFVRGGSGDQNLILIDEAPIYDPSHLLGLVSVFNSDAIKDAELYKGGIPSRYGGRLSSVLDVRTKDGNNKKFGGAGGFGTLAVRAMLEGPLRKEKSSFIFSARRSFIDIISAQKVPIFFYDINAKANWKRGSSNRFFAAFYSGRDKLNINKEINFSWGNATGTFRWNHLFNEKLFSNLTLIASDFDYLSEVEDPLQGFTLKSKIEQISLNYDLDYFMDTKNQLSFGYHLSYKNFQPGIISPSTTNSIFKTTRMPQTHAVENNFYVDNQQKLSEDISLTYGARFSVFQNVGKADVVRYADPTDNVNIVRLDTLHFKSFEPIKTYFNIEPRASARFLVSPKSSIKVSYNRMVQNVHLMAASTLPLPYNVWSPSGYYLKPQVSDQYVAGYFRNFLDNEIEVSVEAFYKDTKNVTDFVDNAQILFNEDLITEIRQGKSWAYGAEFSLQKRKGNLTGFLNYTLSKVMREIPGVNNGIAYHANQDRRNVINLSVAYDLNKKWSFGANFNYSTGRAITLPSGRYEFGPYNVDYMTTRNGYRLPDYHRLDISATYRPQKNNGRRWRGEWVFSICNLYNRKNPLFIYTRVRQDDEGNIIGDGSQKEARLVYVFPFMPAVTYNFKF